MELALIPPQASGL